MRNSLSHEQVEHAGSAARVTTLFADRLPGLDALRAVAMLLGVVVHACVPYSATGLDRLLWPVPPVQTSRVCEVLFWSIHAFRLPLFFFLAGLFSEQLFQARGPQGFARHRLLRLMLPYYVGLVTILPLNLLVWTWGWTRNDGATWWQALSPFESFPPALQAHYFGPAHLWFLMDLGLITLAYGLLRWDWNPNPHQTPSLALPPRLTPWLPTLCAIPAALCLWDDLSPFDQHHNSFVPHTVRMAYFGWYFLLGVQLYRRPALLEQLTRAPARQLLVALLCGAGVAWLTPRHKHNPFDESGLCGLACLVAGTATHSLLGLVGLALRWRPHAGVCRYLADAAYWVYLCHLPLVGLGQVLLQPLAWPAALKMALVTIGAALVGLVSYDLCIRYSFIGTVLHGRRERRSATPQTPPAAPTPAPLPVPPPHWTVAEGRPAHLTSANRGSNQPGSRP
ncbi:MAG: acyltransferase family protein [Planctomycetaceae bacterium]